MDMHKMGHGIRVGVEAEVVQDEGIVLKAAEG